MTRPAAAWPAISAVGEIARATGSATPDGSAAMQQIAAASATLAKMATGLQGLVENFRV
jgi:methyl-accepting chemotaxis protein